MEMYGTLIENAVQFGCSNARARKVSGVQVLVRQAEGRGGAAGRRRCLEMRLEQPCTALLTPIPRLPAPIQIGALPRTPLPPSPPPRSLACSSRATWPSTWSARGASRSPGSQGSRSGPTGEQAPLQRSVSTQLTGPGRGCTPTAKLPLPPSLPPRHQAACRERGAPPPAAGISAACYQPPRAASRDPGAAAAAAAAAAATAAAASGAWCRGAAGLKLFAGAGVVAAAGTAALMMRLCDCW